MQNLTDEQIRVVRSVLKTEGLYDDQIDRIVRSLDEKLPRSSASVTQTAHTVEAGASMTGMVIRGRLG